MAWVDIQEVWQGTDKTVEELEVWRSWGIRGHSKESVGHVGIQVVHQEFVPVVIPVMVLRLAWQLQIEHLKKCDPSHGRSYYRSVASNNQCFSSAFGYFHEQQLNKWNVTKLLTIWLAQACSRCRLNSKCQLLVTYTKHRILGWASHFPIGLLSSSFSMIGASCSSSDNCYVTTVSMMLSIENQVTCLLTPTWVVLLHVLVILILTELILTSALRDSRHW